MAHRWTPSEDTATCPPGRPALTRKELELKISGVPKCRLQRVHAQFQHIKPPRGPCGWPSHVISVQDTVSGAAGVVDPALACGSWPIGWAGPRRPSVSGPRGSNARPAPRAFCRKKSRCSRRPVPDRGLLSDCRDEQVEQDHRSARRFQVTDLDLLQAVSPQRFEHDPLLERRRESQCLLKALEYTSRLSEKAGPPVRPLRIARHAQVEHIPM